MDKELNIGKRNRKRGKNTERSIAKIVGGKRVGVLGKHDIETERFCIEVKDRESSVTHTFMEQAVRNCLNGKTPLVIIHKTGTEHGDDLVCMRLKDWQDWFGKF